MDHQLPPPGDWTSWVILGGRGAGKTRAGSEWVRAQVEGARPLDPGRCRRMALLGETLDQVREVMVFGDSGILACCPPDRMPVWQATRHCLVWPNGAEAMAFSAQEPEALRGPQFDGAWADELAKWRKAEAVWDMLQFALRLGQHPQVCVTTTPRGVPLLKDLLARGSTVMTHAPTRANAANLAASFLREVEARYGGTALGRQELDGLLIEEIEGALWTHPMIDAARIPEVPETVRIVVALDPPATGTETSDACGIVVAGLTSEGLGVVLEDATVQGVRPAAWAEAAIAAMARWGADRLVAEVNQGGDMVEEVLRAVDPALPVTKVRASRGKTARAEPIASLYERGQVRHLVGLAKLEEQMCRMTNRGYDGQGSPDRVDALVWALTELMLRGSKAARPGVRSI